MELSIIICSHNRAKALENALISIVAMIGLADFKWEVIVVDNASEDNTKEIVEKYINSCTVPIRYVREEQKGLSFARNSGASEAKGKLLAFTDDDVIVDKNWAGNIIIAFNKYNVACIGGKILPIWEQPRPKWLTEKLHAKLALLDYGDHPLLMDRPDLWGANLVIKTDIYQRFGPFDTRRGRVPDKLYGGEETNLIAKVLSGKEKVMYVPDLVVYHCISERRMQKKYFRKWVFDQGELAGILLGQYSNRNVFGIPLFVIKALITDLINLPMALMMANENCFLCQLDLMRSLGIIAGRLKWNKNCDSQTN